MAQITSAQFDEEYKKFLAEGGYMSEADLNLARRDPAAGLSLISYKRDYANAPDDAARATANRGAENIRATYGGYTSGKDGSSFYLSNPTPSSFVKAEKPTYADSYKDKHNELLGAVMDFGDFEYDYEKDPNYQAFAKAYAREGDRATKNALTETAAQTGGVASSYAATAAAQAGNYYASQMADKVPQLYDAAYNRYLNQFQMAQGKLSAVEAARQMERAMYESDLNQHNVDNNFDYGQHLDQIAYIDERDDRALKLALTAADQGDFSRLRDLGIDTAQAEALYGYGVRGAELENALIEQNIAGKEISNESARFAAAVDIYNATGNVEALAAAGITNTEQLGKLWQAQTSAYLAENNIKVSQAQLDYAIALASQGNFSALAGLVGTENAAELRREWEAVRAYESTIRSQDTAAGALALEKAELGNRAMLLEEALTAGEISNDWGEAERMLGLDPATIAEYQKEVAASKQSSGEEDMPDAVELYDRMYKVMTNFDVEDDLKGVKAQLRAIIAASGYSPVALQMLYELDAELNTGLYAELAEELLGSQVTD